MPRTVARVNNPVMSGSLTTPGRGCCRVYPASDDRPVEEAVEVGDVVRLLTLQAGGATSPSTPYRMTTPSSVTAWITCSGPSIRCSPQSCVTAAPIPPSADVAIEGGDELFFITTIAGEDQIRALFA